MSLEVDKDQENQFQNEAYLGKPFPTQYGTRGPRDSDNCTDIFCAILFILYVAGMVALVVILRPKAHVAQMRELMDSSGNKCGVDPGFEEYKTLYFFKFSRDYKSVCVKDCPKFDYAQIKLNSTGTATDYIQPVFFSNFSAAVKASKTI